MDNHQDRVLVKSAKELVALTAKETPMSTSLISSGAAATATNKTFSTHAAAPKNGTKDCAHISLIIPMIPSHLSRVDKLLKSIAAGTRVPCEVLISLSSCTAQNKCQPPFFPIPPRLQQHVQIYPTRERQNAAQNRNVLATRARMPILACLDADDQQGRLRIQAIEQVFARHTQIDFLLHKWFWCVKGEPSNVRLPGTHGTPPMDQDPHFLVPVNPLVPAHLKALNTSDPSSVSKMERWTCCVTRAKPAWANGHIVVRRDVWRAHPQNENLNRAEDATLVAELVLHGHKGVFVNRQLTGYCHEVRNALTPHLELKNMDRYYKLNGLTKKFPPVW